MLRECPQPYIDQEARDVLTMASFAERGILPRKGGLLEQKNREIALIQIAWGQISEALDSKKPSNGSQET